MQPHLPRFHHNNAVLCCILSFQLFITLANTTCKLPVDGVLTPKHVGVIYYLFTVLTGAYVGIIIINIKYTRNSYRINKPIKL
jgi:hypothetical protein